ncbi:MAG TPA: hypothetical protein VFP87_01605 [Chitinophagaceae bacterium]|nr:hypothetical protein [Chitinophagaceae bacterium]
MNKKIETYKELIEHKQKLEVLLHAQKELIRADVDELKLELRPLSGVAAHIKKFTTRDKTALLVSISSDIIAQNIFKRMVLARAGWLMKTVLPYFIKNYSSNFLKEQKDKFIDRLRVILKHTNGKEDKEASASPPDEGHVT